MYFPGECVAQVRLTTKSALSQSLTHLSSKEVSRAEALKMISADKKFHTGGGPYLLKLEALWLLSRTSVQGETETQGGLSPAWMRIRSIMLAQSSRKAFCANTININGSFTRVQMFSEWIVPPNCAFSPQTASFSSPSSYYNPQRLFLVDSRPTWSAF